jgi:hypothetical protein
MRFLWLLWQFVMFLAGGALLIGVVIAVWYGFSYLLLALAGHLFKLRGRTPKD